MAWLTEMCQWGWILRFQIHSQFHFALFPCLILVGRELSSQLLFQWHACLPAAMLPTRMVINSNPPEPWALNAFFYSLSRLWSLITGKKKREEKETKVWICVSMIHPWSLLIRFVQRDDHPLNSPIRSSLGLGLFYLLREHQPAIVFLVSLCQSMRETGTERQRAVC